MRITDRIFTMRIVVQRVKRAQVRVENKVVGSIAGGLFILLGVATGDTQENVDYLVEKLVKLRVLSDAADKMNLSLRDKNTSVLVVSQFTLYADTSKGNRPSFIKAADPQLAKKLYESFIQKLKGYGLSVAAGSFGAYMLIDCELDGPVTIILEK